MKRICLGVLLCVILLAVVLVFSGCRGLGETAQERSQDHARQMRLEGQMLIDDIDAIFHADRVSRLSEYTIR